MVRRADANNNNVIEPAEMENGFGRFVQRMAERAGLRTNQALRVDEIERSRGTSPTSSSPSSSYSTATAATTNPQAFGAQSQVALVPGFDSAPGTTAATSQVPLEQRFDERVLDLEELAARYQSRYGGYSSGGPSGYSSYSGSSYPGSSSPSSSSWGYRPPFSGPTMMTTTPPSSSSSPSSTASSSSSSNDRYREFAETMIRRNAGSGEH
jgi:hypothetical protein